MNLLSIGIFAVILFVAQVSASALITYLWGTPDLISKPMWLLGQYSLFILVSTIIFVFLARLHFSKPYLKAFIVAIIAEILGVLASAIIAGEFLDPLATIFNIPAVLFSVFLGTTFGLRFKSKSQNLQLNKKIQHTQK